MQGNRNEGRKTKDKVKKKGEHSVERGRSSNNENSRRQNISQFPLQTWGTTTQHLPRIDWVHHFDSLLRQLFDIFHCLFLLLQPVLIHVQPCSPLLPIVSMNVLVGSGLMRYKATEKLETQHNWHCTTDHCNDCHYSSDFLNDCVTTHQMSSHCLQSLICPCSVSQRCASSHCDEPACPRKWIYTRFCRSECGGQSHHNHPLCSFCSKDTAVTKICNWTSQGLMKMWLRLNKIVN